LKAPRFEYRAPRSLEEALEALADAPDETSLLAGGQSLMPLLNLRMARPEILVDLGRVDELAGVERLDGTLRIGAMVRQRRLETDASIATDIPLLPEAAGFVAHVPIRTRGTVGGSLAHADPSAELLPTMAALGATLRVRRAGAAARTVPAESFAVGPLMTVLEPGEMVVSVDVPIPARGTGWSFQEVARTHGAFALAGAAAVVRSDGEGRIAHARLALCGVGGVPYVPAWVGDSLARQVPGEALFAAIGRRVRDEVAPFADGHAGSEYRRRVAGVLAARALATAARRAGNHVDGGLEERG